MCDREDDVDDGEWEYIPVETADEIMSCGDVVESNQLKNWTRWLEIRKQQHKDLGLKVCRSSTSLLMNKADKFRSKVEHKWMAAVSIQMKTNSEYTRDFPHSISKEINKFTSVHVPDVVRAEKGLFVGCRRDVGIDLETPTLAGETCGSDQINNVLKRLMPFKSAEKLAVVGENIFNKIPEFKYSGAIPSIRVDEPVPENETCGGGCDQYALIVVRVNDFVIKSVNDSRNEFETYGLDTTPRPINVGRVNEDMWDEIVVENCGQISVNYKWEKRERITTEYDDILNEQRTECFYFDTRAGVLGPGQINRLTVLFRPSSIGTHIETWFCQVEILGKSDPIGRVEVSLQGCAVSDPDDETVAIKDLLNTILSGKDADTKSTDTISQNVFSKSIPSVFEKYHNHEGKMKDLRLKLQTEKHLSIEEFLCQCMRLEQSFREKFLDIISHTAVILLKSEIVFESSRMTQRELNAHKTMYIAMDCIDLITYTYEPDFNEVCQELSITAADEVPSKLKIVSDNELSVNDTKEQIVNYSTLREEWREMIKPMICKRLEWAVERIFDFNIQWPECNHGNAP